MSRTLKNRKYYELHKTLPSWKWQIGKPVEIINTSLTIYGLHPKGKVVLLGTQNICPVSRGSLLITPEMKKSLRGWKAERLISYAGVNNPEAMREHLQQDSDKVWNSPFNFVLK